MKSFLRNVAVMTVLVIAASTVCHVIVPAFAQTTAPVLEYKIDLRPLLDVVWPLIVALVTAIVGVLARKALSWLKLSEDRMVREYLEIAIVNGLELARQKLGPITPVTTKSQVIAEASGYIIARVPDALKRFDIDQASLKRLVEARLGMIEPLPDGTNRLTSVK